MSIIDTHIESKAQQLSETDMRRSTGGNLRAIAFMVLGGVATVTWAGFLIWVTLAALGY